MIFIKKNKFLIIYEIILISFTIYLLCDTFLISKIYQIVDNNNPTTNNKNDSSINTNDKINSKRKKYQKSSNKGNNIDNNTENTIKKEITNTSYKDKGIEIAIQDYNENNTKIYVADVILNDISKFKTAFAQSSYGKNVTDYTSSIAKSVNAILAINGDYYGVQESGYVLKNGVIYRNTASNREDLVIYKDGSFEIINEKEITLEKLKEQGAYNVLSFGPALIKDSKISVSQSDEVGRAMASNPRTAIGIIDKNHYIFAVSDGRTNESEGLSLYELATFMKSLGCTTAYNLDGGGSSTMYFNGSVINNPTTNGNIKERKVSDIVYIGV